MNQLYDWYSCYCYKLYSSGMLQSQKRSVERHSFFIAPKLRILELFEGRGKAVLAQPYMDANPVCAHFDQVLEVQASRR